MSLRTLPEIRAFERPDGFAFEPDEDALARFNGGLRAANEGDDNVISIYDVIGYDFWTGEGVTSKRVAAALRRIGDREVTVNINSPGGDFFEGVAIYNLLREHPHRVTVKVMGLAASAASVIAMAGDRIEISAVSFMMVHNAWVLAVGNRHDMREAAEFLEPFDDAMAELYSARAGVEKKEAVAWMDEETWFNGARAIEAGLADAVLSSDQVAENDTGSANATAAVRKVDRLMAKEGIPRTERRSLIAQIRDSVPRGGTQDAAATATRDAGDIVAGLDRLKQTLKI